VGEDGHTQVFGFQRSEEVDEFWEIFSLKIILRLFFKT
jgi:hypothetical protein